MNPFRRFTQLQLAPALRRWRVARQDNIPAEKPPRSRVPRGRLRILWSGDLTGPFPFETEEPPRLWDRF